MMWWKIAGLPCSAGRWSADGKARACDVVPCVDGGGDAGKAGWGAAAMGAAQGNAHAMSCRIVPCLICGGWRVRRKVRSGAVVDRKMVSGEPCRAGVGRCGGSGLTCCPVSEGGLWLAGCRFWRLRCTSGGRLRGRRGCRCRFRGTVPAGTGRRAVRLVRLAG